MNYDLSSHNWDNLYISLTDGSLLVYNRCVYIYIYIRTSMLACMLACMYMSLLSYLLTCLVNYSLACLLTYVLPSFLTYVLTYFLTFFLTYLLTWLVVWNIFLFSRMYWIILPIDEYVSRWLKPPTSYFLTYLLTFLLTYFLTYLLTCLLTYLHTHIYIYMYIHMHTVFARGKLTYTLHVENPPVVDHFPRETLGFTSMLVCRRVYLIYLIWIIY